ncbi:MAG: polyphosphate polymerase domain-containing protein [Planctomycetes bacterium]|nr:polyphosphate polymerase domain-containing protein [Planctomycetota bacterium]
MTRSLATSSVTEHDARSLSPSLCVTPQQGAFEWKFLVAEKVAAPIEAWARQELLPDPHGDGGAPGRYRTTTLYLDTKALDLFHRKNGFGAVKHRMRRYGDGDALHLERKVRHGEQVSKARCTAESGVAALASGGLAAAVATVLAARRGAAGGAEHSFAGEFAAQVAVAGLVPSCRLSYERTAFFAANAEGAHRLTLDRAIRGELATDWRVATVATGESLLGRDVILELKFVGALPARFKSLLADYRLAPSGVSKYRRFLAIALGGRIGG